jgi:glycosyltransferase involved in cell wall biosynthesis
MPLNLLWLQTGAQIGGTELINFRIWQRLNKTRFSVQVCFLDEPGPISDLYRQEGCEPVHLRYHERPLSQVWHHWQQLLTDHRPDILHIFGTRANLLGRLTARRYARARLISGQHNAGSSHPATRWVERATSRQVDLYIANSQAGARWLQTHGHIPPQKMVIIHNGLDVTPYMAAERGQLRPLLGSPSHEPVIVSVGNLRKVKDQETLLTAARTLGDDGCGFQLWLVGDGQRRVALEKLAQAFNLQDRIHFLGWRSDVSAILADADIKVLSSRTEGLPTAIMEAMAAGLPVVATAVGGVPELVQDNLTGLLVPPDDPPALATALAKLLVNPPLRQQFGRAGQQRIQTHFALTDKVAELEQVYSRIVSSAI